MAASAALSASQNVRMVAPRTLTAALPAASHRQTLAVARAGKGFAPLTSSSASFRSCRTARPPAARNSAREALTVTAGSSPLGADSTSAVTAGPAGDGDDGDTWQWKILYDGDCPICTKNARFLEARNDRYNTLRFVNIADEDYNPDENEGVTFEAAMGTIHGISRDGTIVTGVEAFRKFYDAVGLGWVVSLTTFPPIAALADALYAVVAKYRLPLSGHPSLQAILDERRRTVAGYKGCTEDEPCEAEY